MANTVLSLFSIVLLWMITAEGRKTLHLNNEWLTFSPFINDIDGVCKTMVETQGYTCEEHEVHITKYLVASTCHWFWSHFRELFFCWSQVTTEDGYILSMQRILAGQSSQKADKPPVLLQHGIFCVSCVNADLYIRKANITCLSAKTLKRTNIRCSLRCLVLFSC